MTDSNFTTIEINGIKMEVDLRYAKRIDTLRVGSKVRILAKKSAYGTPEVYSGVIVGFEPFKDRPTIIVCYIKQNYGTAGVEFAYINPQTDEWDLVPAVDDDMPLNKAKIMDSFEVEIQKHKRLIEDIERKRAYFTDHFGIYFPTVESENV